MNKEDVTFLTILLTAAAMLSLTSAFGLASAQYGYYIQIATVERSDTGTITDANANMNAATTTMIPTDSSSNTIKTTSTSSINTTTEKGSMNNIIQLTAKEVDGVYVWSSNSKTNPTLKLLANNDNIIQAQSLPNDEQEHQLKIESPEGKELAKSKEIRGGSSDEITFNPDENGILKYYCKYHPDTMKGTIEVVS